MFSSHAGLISRSSSTALSMAQPHDVQDPISITVAQELLNRPKHTRQRSTFTTASSRSYQLDGTVPQQQAMEDSTFAYPDGRTRRAGRTSNTWTSSSGDVLSDNQDEIDDRTLFIQEYNRLARKHGVRPIVPEEHEPNDDSISSFIKHANWFSRKILRRTSSSQSIRLKNDRNLKHMRSISDSLRMKKRDKLKDKDLQDLAKLCGLSLLYLPTEYSAGSLSVPTCFRATAQFLVQHAPSTRGVFRIPGSQNAVAALYNHFCSMDEEGQVIAGTVRCPTLPDHIRCDTHDVASAFKKFLAGLPGGILGSLALFNAFISIQTQFQGDAELTRTKQSKVRARLIALAVATLRSQYRRELICAVFGLLSMIGRAAETAPREDERGRPLPTSDLMGYGPLGIVFGPLLVGDLMDDYSVRLANPHGGLILLPISPPKSRKERSRKGRSGDEGTTFSNHIDKIKVANSITEMLITHWRDVVRHMRNLSALKIGAGTQSLAARSFNPPMLRPSASETFALRKPPDWDQLGSPLARRERSVSPTPNRRPSGALTILSDHEDQSHQVDSLKVKKQRVKLNPTSNHWISGHASKTILSPTREESPKENNQQAHPLISETQQRSTIQSSLEENDIKLPRHSHRQHDVELTVQASNSSFAKENKHPAGAYESVLDPTHQRLDSSDRHMHVEKEELLHSQGQARDGKISVRQEHGVDKSTSETSIRMERREPEAVTSATPLKSSNPSSDLRHSQWYAEGEWPRTSGDELQTPKTTTRETNKLTKSPERAQARNSGTKATNLAGKHGKQDTPNKKSKTGRSSGLKSSTSATDANTQVMHFDVHDKFWPFDRMPGSTLSDSSNTHSSKLEITISRTSSRDFGNIQSNASRKLGGSEPGLQPSASNLAAPGNRRASRSLDDNLRRRSKIPGNQRMSLIKDPLSRISHQEDMASLAELAQVLDYADTPQVISGVQAQDLSSSVHQTGSLEYQNQFSSDHHSSRRDQTSFRLPDEKQSPQDNDPIVERQARHHKNFSFESKNSTSTGYLSKTQLAEGEHTSDIVNERQYGSTTRVLNNLDNKNVQFTPRKRTGSPRSPSSKISALVAKYNNGDATPVLPPSTPSPLKSPAKSLPREPSGKVEAFRDGLIAPYTVNPPTPTRSQMSGRSDRTPQRTPDFVVKPLNYPRTASPTKIPAPKRLLRSSLEDKTPLRHTQKSVEGIITPSNTSLPTNIAQKSTDEPVEPSPKFFDGSTSKAASRTPSQTPNLGPHDATVLVIQRLARSTSRTSTPPPSIRRSLDEIVTEIRGPMPSLLHPATLRTVRELTEASTEDGTNEPSSHSFDVLPLHDELSDSAHDGPAGELKLHPVPRPRAPLIRVPTLRSSQSASEFAGFVHPDSPFKDTFSTPVSPVASPAPTRRSSVLYTEIKRLQKDLATEKDNVLQLRHQLETRQNLDFNSLSEELREARKEIEKWKTRAKVAEKQLELVFKVPSRSLSTQLAYSSIPRVSERIDSSRTDGPSDSLRAVESLRKIFNGTDGAASSEESRHSTDTVIRDIHGVVTGSEYSIWVEQTMNALDTAEASD